MKICNFIVFLLISTHAIGDVDNVSDAVSVSVGKILLFQDLNTRYQAGNVGLGHYYLPDMINKEYKSSISDLDVDNRLRFIWGVISFAKFGSHGTEEFSSLIESCCAKEFVLSAEEYINQADVNRKKSSAYVDERMVNKANFFLKALRSYR